MDEAKQEYTWCGADDAPNVTTRPYNGEEYLCREQGKCFRCQMMFVYLETLESAGLDSSKVVDKNVFVSEPLPSKVGFVLKN